METGAYRDELVLVLLQLRGCCLGNRATAFRFQGGFTNLSPPEVAIPFATLG
jgi:hypothetical protein